MPNQKEPDRLRVCIDIRASGAAAGGIGAFTAGAFEALISRPPAKGIVLLIGQGAAKGVQLPAFASVIEAPAGNWLWSETELPVILEERSVDVFFSPLFTCPVVRSARHVITLHDVFPESHRELCTPDFLAFWQHKIGPSLRSACHAVAVSEWSKNEVVTRLKLPPERISVVHQSVSRTFGPRKPAEVAPVLGKYGLRGGGYILYVGAMDPRKNLDRLIRAFSQLKARDLLLVLAGRAVVKGYDAGESARRCGVADRVKLLGHVPDEDLPALYCGSRCFAFPSLAEGFGRPPVEAMACRVPVVASNRAALPETCAQAALLPDPEDEGALAQALETACFSEPERTRLIEAGIRRAAEFSAERFGADLFKAFENALAGPEEGLWPR